MTPVPPIRSFADVQKVLQSWYTDLGAGDTIVRARTLANTMLVASGTTSGETVVSEGAGLTGVPSGAVNRAPTWDVTIRAPYSLTASGYYTIASGYTVTIEADAELRIL